MKHAILALALLGAAPGPAPSATPNPQVQMIQQTFNTFYLSVYAPICDDHQGLADVKRAGSGAWPATIVCRDGSSIVKKGPGN